MAKEHPDHHDAELLLKLYDLRREPVMRESRQGINRNFWPKDYAEFSTFTKPEHPLNAALRQISSYWEMVYGMARWGIMHAEYLAEYSGEGLFLYARVKPFLEQHRAEASPVAFMNAQWMTENTAAGKRLLQAFDARIQKYHDAKKHQ
ncbi:hypothetical protein BH09SUM1_BH09SUM1_24840 [soil metagenome]